LPQIYIPIELFHAGTTLELIYVNPPTAIGADIANLTQSYETLEKILYRTGDYRERRPLPHCGMTKVIS